MVAPVVQTTATGAGASGPSPHSVTLPSGITAGDLLVVVWSRIVFASVTSVTTPSGWTEATGSPAVQGWGGSGETIRVYYKTATGSEGSTISMAFDDNGGQTAWSGYRTYRISGADLGSPIIAATMSGEAGGYYPDPPDNSPGSTKDWLWLAVAYNYSASYSSGPSGYSNYGEVESNYCKCAFAEKTSSGVSSENPGSFALEGWGKWGAATIAIAPTPPTQTALPFIESTPAVYGPTLIYTQALTLDFISSTPAAYAPRLPAGSVQFVVPYIDRTPDIFAPTLWDTHTLVLPFLDAGATTYTPAIFFEGQSYVILPFIDGLGAIFIPVVRPNLYPWRTHTIQYHAIIFSQDANGGPGLPKMELDADMLNLTWQSSLNFPGQAAFTLSRFNPKLAELLYMQDHIKIYREDAGTTTCVFAGKLVKPSKGPRDSIIYCWDYTSFLQRSRTGYKVLYPNKKIGTEIMRPEWELAKNVAGSPFAFIETGTFEDPLALDGLTPITVNSSFGVLDFDRLFTFHALAEMAMANTSNTVVFEITRDTPHTFNFWKNRSTARETWHLTYPGNVIDYALDPGHDEIVNDLATLITDAASGQQVEYALADQTSIDQYRRLQSAVTIKTLYGISTGTTETDQQKAALARIITQAVQVPKLLTAFPRQGEIQPFVGWNLGDSFRVTLQNPDRVGDELDTYLKCVGMSVAYTPEAGELVQLYMR